MGMYVRATSEFVFSLGLSFPATWTTAEVARPHFGSFFFGLRPFPNCPIGNIWLCKSPFLAPNIRTKFLDTLPLSRWTESFDRMEKEMWEASEKTLFLFSNNKSINNE